MTHRHKDTEEHTLASRDNGSSSSLSGVLGFDPEDYMHHMEDFDMSPGQKRDALYALWHIMATIVDIGFGLDTVHIVLPNIFENASRDSRKLVEKKSIQNTVASTPLIRAGNSDE